jgi:hypothetical protein
MYDGSPQDGSSRSFWAVLWRYLACYGSWIGLSAVGLWMVFLVRAALVDLSMAFRANPWTLRAIDRFGLYLLGMAWLVGIIFLEAYLRQGMESAQLRNRIRRILLAEIVVVISSYALQLI